MEKTLFFLILLTAHNNCEIDVFKNVQNNHPWILTQKMPTVYRNLLLLKEDCGEVCDTSDRFKKNKGKYFDVIEKQFECDILLTSPIMNPPVIKEEQMHNVRNCFISNIIYLHNYFIMFVCLPILPSYMSHFSVLSC